MARKVVFVLIVAVAGLSWSTGFAAADEAQSPDKRQTHELPASLRVVVVGSTPFIEEAANGELTGPSLEVWRRAAGDMGVSYELTRADSVDAALAQVASHQVDVAVGPISITAQRATQVAFTQPYFRSSLGIASRREEDFFQRVEPFLSAAFLTALGALLLVLAVVGTLMWLFERKQNPEQFPLRFVPGVGNGVWFALVTMTTVGYGDRAPQTVGGRLVAGVWMLLALITVSSLTAGIATALTLSQLEPGAVEKAGDLEGRRVATLNGSNSETFVRLHGGVVVGVAHLKEALDHVAEGTAAAVVFDRPALMYAIANAPGMGLHLSPRRYNEQGYGFAVGLTSGLDEHLDAALLRGASENDKLFEEFESEE